MITKFILNILLKMIGATAGGLLGGLIVAVFILGNIWIIIKRFFKK